MDEIENEEIANDPLTDKILTKKITVRENFLPKQKYFHPTPSRWLMCPEYDRSLIFILYDF